MQSVWSNLRACLSPYKLKLLALKTLAWPRALYAYAVSVVPVGTQHYRSLRTGAMKGLRANRVGSNPVLHLATQDLQNDPEAWAIIQTFRDTREYRDPGALEAVLGLFADASGELPQNGPVAALWERIQRLGWEISPAGLITDKVGSFSLAAIPIQELIQGSPHRASRHCRSADGPSCIWCIRPSVHPMHVRRNHFHSESPGKVSAWSHRSVQILPSQGWVRAPYVAVPALRRVPQRYPKRRHGRDQCPASLCSPSWVAPPTGRS